MKFIVIELNPFVNSMLPVRLIKDCCEFKEINFSKILSSSANVTQLVRGTVMASGLVVRKEYTVSLSVFLTAFASGFHNIIHFTTGNHTGSPGARIPAVFVNGGLEILHICSDVDDNHNHCLNTDKVQLNTWIDIEIRQDLIDGVYKYKILIDGILKHEQINSVPVVHRNVKLYVSDIWYPAQPGFIRNLAYNAGLFCLRQGSRLHVGFCENYVNLGHFLELIFNDCHSTF